MDDPRSGRFAVLSKHAQIMLARTSYSSECYELVNNSHGVFRLTGLEAVLLSVFTGQHTINEISEAFAPVLKGGQSVGSLSNLLLQLVEWHSCVQLRATRGNRVRPNQPMPWDVAAFRNKAATAVRDFPSTIHLGLTDACNLQCGYCYRKPRRQVGNLSSLTVHEILTEGAKKECRMVTFSGGEPLLDPNLSSYISETRALGMMPIVITNGVLLHRLLDEVDQEILPILRISLDTVEPATFVRLTGSSKLTLRRVQRNIEMAVGKGISVIVQAALTPLNCTEVQQLIEYCERIGVTQLILSAANMGFHRSLREHYVDIQDLAPIRALLDSRAQQYARGMGVHLNWPTFSFTQSCSGLLNSTCVNADGSVVLCTYLTKPVLGNVNQHSLGTIWHGRAYEALRTDLLSHKGMSDCVDCMEINDCRRGCPALKVAAGVDLMAPDPRCTGVPFSGAVGEFRQENNRRSKSVCSS